MRTPPEKTGHVGWIEVIAGSMFSGKSEELIRRLRRAEIARQRVQVFKPAIDDRYSVDDVVSHSSQRIASERVTRAAEILERIDPEVQVVGIDEAQFLDLDLVAVCERLANAGVRVIVAGLDQDYRGRPFEPMPQLLAVAEYITKTRAICVRCGQRRCARSASAPAPSGSSSALARPTSRVAGPATTIPRRRAAALPGGRSVAAPHAACLPTVASIRSRPRLPRLGADTYSLTFSGAASAGVRGGPCPAWPTTWRAFESGWRLRRHVRDGVPTPSSSWRSPRVMALASFERCGNWVARFR
jgi:thymidine kinase